MRPGNILVFTNSRDTHAHAVAHVLRHMGQVPVVINTANLTRSEHISVDYKQDDIWLRIGSYLGKVEDITSSWNRRFSKLFSLPHNLHPADRTYVQNNTQATLTGILGLLDNRFPVNPLAASRYHSNKVMQLKRAAAAGFRIPKTLISNDFDDIDSFISGVGDVCVKSYYAHGWKTESGPVQAVTVRLDRNERLDRASYEISPHIYQEYISKKAEYRLTIFGGFSATLKIDSQALIGGANVDWRASPAYLTNLTPYSLPPRVVNAARRVLSDLGLRFGAFDIAETFDGDFVFFEVNEAGQWLWQELHSPECRILQPFCEYIASADDSYQWDARRICHDYDASRVCELLDVDPEFASQDPFDFPDEGIHVADERLDR